MKTQGRPDSSNLATTGGNNGQIQRSTLKQILEKNSARLAQAAAGFMKPDDMIRMTLLAASRQPDLLKCTTESIIRALMDAAQLKIKPGGVLGRGYLVSRRNGKTGQLECIFDCGYKGCIDIALRNPEIESISAHVVYKNELFKYIAGTTERIEHEIMLDGDRGPIVAAYAVAKYKSGGTQIEVVTKIDLDKIRNSSASKNGPWATWPDEMSRKTAVRRLFKYLPLTDELAKAIELSDKVDGTMDLDVHPDEGSITTDGEVIDNEQDVPDDVSPMDASSPPL